MDSAYDNLSQIMQQFVADKLYEVPTPLCEILARHGSDKSTSHNYATLYYRLFNDIRNQPLNVFEVGLGTNNTSIPSNMGPGGIPGASLRGWREFFPNAQIYGADIDSGCLFQEERIKTYFTDQQDPTTIQEMWCNPDLAGIEIDILLDDGLHNYNANRCFFENSFHKVRKGGIYILEDIYHTYEENVHRWFEELIDTSAASFVTTIKLPIYNDYYNGWTPDNCLGIVVK